ncbi:MULTISPECIES: alpha/beta fold hydrolase [unclassified Luteococcus]|uniref:alpha/beta fold hydrolase n=1 Tax=unclassified Luteococcus TaxID=2639923 RepID=UPI00313E4298
MVEPKGHVVRCAGREMHWREREGTDPAVVLMSGCGLAMEFWRDLIGLLPGVRVLSYDRPGMGRTRWPGHLPRLAEEVASLAELLDQRGITRAVLVAHSMAAFHAEALARIRPNLVSGVVLVDGSVEWYATRPDLPAPTIARRVGRVVDALSLNRLAGMTFRFGTYLQSNHEFSKLGYGRIPAIYRDADSLAMGVAESMAYERQGWDLLQLRPRYPWPGVPTVVLSAADAEDGRWVATQKRLAHLLGARQVVVPDSKHLMMLDRPDVIVDAIHAVRPS